MLCKKPVVLVSSYGNLCNLSQLHSSCSQSCASHIRPPHTRHYAQHAPHPHYDETASSWPTPTPPHTMPTPYQILSTRHDEVYSKLRFYQLVKLYHPDRIDPASPIAQLPTAVRLERYRLLVAAHSILADDAKRRAYDAWGYGWAGHRPSPPLHTPHERKSWEPKHDPMYNATWEDWERWYDQEHGRQRETSRAMHMSNFGFVSMVFALVSLGGIMQGTRANMMSSSYMEQRDKVHKEASMELMKSKRATLSGDRQERIRTFMEHREATNAGTDAYQRLLPPSEPCTPDTVRRQ